MIREVQHKQWKDFFVSIILPTLVAIILTVGAIYMIIIPTFEDTFFQSKKDMIKELTHSAYSILQKYHQEETSGILSAEEAKNRALSEISALRYGDDNNDYFWVTDMEPKMLMHPFFKDLIGKNLSDYQDYNGKAFFLEIRNKLRTQQEAFINYTWFAKDNTQRIVPKLSYVQKFDPWHWTIGTGVYLDDVHRKTAKITHHLSLMTFGTACVIAMLLLYITQQSLKIEKKRREAEFGLRKSGEKYKALVEAANDGTMIYLDKHFNFANQTMIRMLGYSTEELEKLSLEDIFPGGSQEDSGYKKIKRAIEEKQSQIQFETFLQTKNEDILNVVLTVSTIKIMDQNAYVMIAKDIQSQKKIVEELGASKEKFRFLTNHLNVGVFRTRFGNKCRFIEANEAAMKIFGFSDESEMLKSAVTDIFENADDKTNLRDTLLKDGRVKNKILPLQKDKDSNPIVSISMVMVKDKNGTPIHCDGIIEDITEQKKTEENRENLIIELQTSLLYLNQPIKHALKDFTTCDMDTTIAVAARTMVKEKSSSILVQSHSGDMIGIITDQALKERVTATGLSLDTPVYEIMSSPLIYIEDTALIFEAVLIMQEKRIKHLVVKDTTGSTVGVIANDELLQVHRYSTGFMIQEIHKAEAVEDIVSSQDRMPRLVKALTDSGAHAKNITRIITSVSDSIAEKLIGFAIEELGEPPVKFAFMSLGSEGRGEQTLVTDQDNAIIYEDVPEELEEFTRDYFRQLGTKVCTWLDQAGYSFCTGEVMAMNPKWCQPLSQWKRYFSSWTTEAKPQDLLELNIFFDFRALYGEKQFTDDLRTHLQEMLETKKGFLPVMAQNSLLFKPPVDFFGNISLESGGEHDHTFSIKVAMAPIVSFARIYSIRHGLANTNTLERLDRLLEKHIINQATHDEMIDAYNYLMQMRFKHQIKLISDGLEPNNFIDPDQLSYMEKSMLKKTFSQISGFQKKLSYDFTGVS